MKTLEQHINLWIVKLFKEMSEEILSLTRGTGRDIAVSSPPGSVPELVVRENMGPSHGWVTQYVNAELNIEMGQLIFDIFGEVTLDFDIDANPETIISKVSEKIVSNLQ